jgi:hypothetical protein
MKRAGVCVVGVHNLMQRNLITWIVCGLALAGNCLVAAETNAFSVKRIWDAGQHNAFTDLIHFQGKWFCTFRESEAHVGGNGKIRVLTSGDAERWESAALLTEAGVDLRDPKFSITSDGRLMLALGGSIYEGKILKGRQPRVSFSRDGLAWSAPQKVLSEGDWLWRVTWHEGKAYGITYLSAPAGATKSTTPAEWIVKLVESTNGVDYRVLKEFDVTGRPNEATVRFLANGDGVILLRRETKDKEAWIGVSKAPYTDWKWQSAGMFVGGPNFIQLPNGKLVASGRQMAPGGPKTFVGEMTMNSITPKDILPSGGDCSYPGLVWHENKLWVSYYSSHEGKSSIYLAKVNWPLR